MTMTTGRLFENKRVLVFGLANERSIAWGITQAMQQHGAKFVFTYAGEVMEKRVRPLAESVGAELILPCDVSDDAQLDAVFEQVGSLDGGLHAVVHSVAFAPREDLEGRFSDTSREGFRIALDVSAYSLIAIARRAAPLLAPNKGSIVTLTYYGAEKVVENYNVMGVAKAALEASLRYLAADLGPDGVRINGISAGAIKTLASSGVKGFRSILGVIEQRAPLRRNVTQEEVGRTALYLCSDLASGVTGEVVHVDGGYSILGL
jgi:enoyl-[acyl-carrier protein] reductase I